LLIDLVERRRASHEEETAVIAGGATLDLHRGDVNVGDDPEKLREESCAEVTAGMTLGCALRFEPVGGCDRNDTRVKGILLDGAPPQLAEKVAQLRPEDVCRDLCELLIRQTPSEKAKNPLGR